MKKLVLTLILISSQSLFARDESAKFYTKSKEVEGLIIKSSNKVQDKSLVAASVIVLKMISKRPDIKRSLIESRADIVVIGPEEKYCDLPEARMLLGVKTFDGRSYCDLCGAGGIAGRPITVICEDNLLKTSNDPYRGYEDILTHEFAHTIHLLGMNEADQEAVRSNYKEAKKQGLFEKNSNGKPTYMMANEQEFFACLSAVWFGVHDVKSLALSPDLINRESIKAKLPSMYSFMKSIYPE